MRLFGKQFIGYACAAVLAAGLVITPNLANAAATGLAVSETQVLDAATVLTASEDAAATFVAPTGAKLLGALNMTKVVVQTSSDSEPDPGGIATLQFAYTTPLAGLTATGKVSDIKVTRMQMNTAGDGPTGDGLPFEYITDGDSGAVYVPSKGGEFFVTLTDKKPLADNADLAPETAYFVHFTILDLYSGVDTALATSIDQDSATDDGNIKAVVLITVDQPAKQVNLAPLGMQFDTTITDSTGANYKLIVMSDAATVSGSANPADGYAMVNAGAGVKATLAALVDKTIVFKQTFTVDDTNRDLLTKSLKDADDLQAVIVEKLNAGPDVTNEPYTLVFADGVDAAGSKYPAGGNFWLTKGDDTILLADHKLSEGTYTVYYSVKDINVVDDAAKPTAFDTDGEIGTGIIANQTRVSYLGTDSSTVPPAPTPIVKYFAPFAAQVDTSNFSDSLGSMAVEATAVADDKVQEVPKGFAATNNGLMLTATAVPKKAVVTFKQTFYPAANLIGKVLGKLDGDTDTLAVRLHLVKDTEAVVEADYYAYGKPSSAVAKHFWVLEGGSAMKATDPFAAGTTYVVYYTVENDGTTPTTFDTGNSEVGIINTSRLIYNDTKPVFDKEAKDAYTPVVIADDTVFRTAAVSTKTADALGVVRPTIAANTKVELYSTAQLTNPSPDGKALQANVPSNGGTVYPAATFKATVPATDSVGLFSTLPFVYEGAEKLAINKANVHLQKLLERNDGKLFFTFMDNNMPADKAVTEDGGGKFWIERVAPAYQDVMYTTAFATETLHLVDGSNAPVEQFLEKGKAYVMFFTVKDNTEFDWTNEDTAGLITDPPVPMTGSNGGDDSSGCTVGTSANYDMALLLLAIMGVVAFRVSRRRA